MSTKLVGGTHGRGLRATTATTMRTSLRATLLSTALFACAVASTAFADRTGTSAGGIRPTAAPTDATRCDASIPIGVEIVPLNDPRVGDVARYEVRVESSLDPDLIREMRVEYQLSSRLEVESGDLEPGPRDARVPRSRIAGKRSSRLELGLRVPDEARHQVRARLIVELVGGQTMAQTADQWIDLGDEDPQEGYLGRIEGPEGAGIRVYRGATEKERR